MYFSIQAIAVLRLPLIVRGDDIYPFSGLAVRIGVRLSGIEQATDAAAFMMDKSKTDTLERRKSAIQEQGARSSPTPERLTRTSRNAEKKSSLSPPFAAVSLASGNMRARAPVISQISYADIYSSSSSIEDWMELQRRIKIANRFSESSRMQTNQSVHRDVPIIRRNGWVAWLANGNFKMGKHAVKEISCASNQ